MSVQSPVLSRRPKIDKSLRMAVLLAGRVGRNAFGDGVKRSVLDLPIADGRTVLDSWVDRFVEFAGDGSRGDFTIRIAIDQVNEAPNLERLGDTGAIRFEVVRDPSDYRGTAGVVRDLTADLARTDAVLVASASQIQLEPLVVALEDLSDREEAVTLVRERGSDLAGLFILQRERLLSVPEIGFVDLKEQALQTAGPLPALRVLRRPSGSSLPVRTRAEYLAALRTLHTDGAAIWAALRSPFAEMWNRSFVLLEPGARVAPSAVLQDCVVLAGGVVEEGAIVARSVVCSDGVVGRGNSAVEMIVTG